MAKKHTKEMSFLDHLEELRWVLVRSSLAILIVGIVSFFFSDYIFNVILFGPKDPNFISYKYFCEASKFFGLSNDLCSTNFDFIIQNTDVEGQFSLLIWACVAVGFIISFPYILLQFWNFIKPALYEHERKMASTFIIISSLLFFIGVLFGYFVIVPMSVNFFATFKVSAEIKNEFNVESFIGMIKTSAIASGLIFELPIIVYFLSKLGLVTPKAMREYRKYSVVAILIVAAIVTPPDIVSQIIVAVPLLILYEISILISAVVNKNLIKNE
jgi:sec-independent protein translocase protein TatC